MGTALRELVCSLVLIESEMSGSGNWKAWKEKSHYCTQFFKDLRDVAKFGTGPDSEPAMYVTSAHDPWQSDLPHRHH